MRRNFVERGDFKNSSLDLHGMRVEDAKQAVNSFIDQNLVSKNLRIKIIYGWGKGILKQVIKQMLTAHEDVSSVEDPLDIQEAAYIVNLKD
jgi:DNA-nicking Smr family endonuclease